MSKSSYFGGMEIGRGKQGKLSLPYSSNLYYHVNMLLYNKKKKKKWHFIEHHLRLLRSNSVNIWMSAVCQVLGMACLVFYFFLAYSFVNNKYLRVILVWNWWMAFFCRHLRRADFYFGLFPRFIVPISCVICNDIMAYMFGFFFGRTPLIKVNGSP